MTIAGKMEQIEAILVGDEVGLARRRLRRQTITAADLREVFDVSREELRSYVMSRSSIADLVVNEENELDGFHVVRAQEGIVTYVQEHGVKEQATTHQSERDVREAFAAYLANARRHVLK
jgi:hypothetical protein